MKNNHLEKFYEEVGNSEELKKVLFNGVKKVQTQEELIKFISEKIIPEAKKLGYEFTLEEFLNYEKEIVSQLSEDELADVSGGTSIKSMMAGSLAALSFFSSLNLDKVGALVANTDVVDIEKIILDKQSSNISTAETRQENQTNFETSELKSTDIQNDIQIAKNNADGENANNNSDIDFEAAQVVQDSLKKRINSFTDDNQKLYFLEALNVLEPYIFRTSKLLQNLRKYGSFDTVGFSEDKSNGEVRREWKYDKGTGIAGLVGFLFPSRSGSLSTATCQLEKDLIPIIINCVYDKRLNIVEDYSEKIENFIRKLNETKGKKTINEKKDSFNDVVDELANDLNDNAAFKSFIINLKGDIKNCRKQDFNGIVDSKIKKLRVLEDVLIDCYKAIDEEEQTQIIPKYTVERILMSFVIDKCQNKSELREILEEIASNLSMSSVTSNDNKTEEIKAQKDRLEKINEVLNTHATNLSPYKKLVCESDDALTISKVGKANVKFNSNTFSDCADVTSRHFLNLISYSKNKNWDFFKIPDEGTQEFTDLERKLLEVRSAIKNKETVKFYSLKERVQMFMIHQKEVGADETDIETRTLWEYVICNMDEGQDNKYSLEYVQDNFELNPGFYNLMKLMYNIAAEFYDPKDNKLAAAKDAIDNSGDIFKALEATVKLFNDREFVIEEEQDEKGFRVRFKLENKGDDINSEKEELEFSVFQSKEHASVSYDPVKTKEGISSEIIKDDIISILLEKEPSNEFHKIYSSTPQQLGTPKENMTEYEKRLRLIYALEHSISENFNRTDYKFVELIDNGIIKLDVSLQPVMDKMKGLWERRVKISRDEEKNLIMEYKGQDDFYFGKRKLDSMDSIGDKVEWLEIAENTFEGDSTQKLDFSKFIKLKNLKIGKCMIGDKEIIFPESLEKLEIGMNMFQGSSIKVLDFSKYSNLKDLKICENAFKDTNQLEEIIFPKSLKKLEIGTDAFEGSSIKVLNFSECFNLKDLIIGNGAFFNATSLGTVNLPKNLKTLQIGDNVFGNGSTEKLSFSNCSDLKSLIIGRANIRYERELSSFPQKIETLEFGHWAFGESNYCIKKMDLSMYSMLKKLKIGETLLYQNLSSVIFPENLEMLEMEKDAFNSILIKDQIFSNCHKLRTLKISEGAFGGTGLETINFPENLETLGLGKDAFSYGLVQVLDFSKCSQLRDLIIDDEAFENETNLKNIILPSGLKGKVEEIEAFKKLKEIITYV